MDSRTKVFTGMLVMVLGAAVGGYAYLDWRAERSAVPDELVLNGNVDIREADLAFNINGRVEKMLVEEGDTVEKGQLLATLETAIYDADIEVAKAEVSARKAALDKLLAGSRPEEIKKARQAFQAIQAQLDDASATLHRTQQLATDRFASLQQLEGEQARVKILEAQMRAAEQELSLVIQGPRNEDIAQARAMLRASEAQLLLAQRRFAYTKLHSKERGVVNTRIVEPGAVVQANTPAYTLALTDPVWVRTYISEPDLGRVHSGMRAEILTDSNPEEPYEGWIGFISPVAEFTPKTIETRELRTSLVYRARVYVKNADNSLRQGMPVTIRIKTEMASESGG